MSIIQLFRDHNIQHQTEGDRHCRPGWVNCTCPFCHSHGPHLGINLQTWHFNCWICGWHRTDLGIAALTGLGLGEVQQLLRRYKGKGPERRAAPRLSVDKKIRLHPFKYPTSSGPLGASHKKYLIQRKFDPDQLIAEWDLKGTGPSAYLDKIDYRFRLIAPIWWDNREVSFQARDITGRSELKYLACPMAREYQHHKDILYGKQSAWSKVGICVEGITDVWRLGVKSFATFGVQLRTPQLLAIVKQFDRVIIVFDAEAPAQERANRIAVQLRSAGVRVEIENIDVGDPGDLSDREAKYLVRQLVKEV